ncbi:permease, partial [Myxococcota bacterium]|nr:permease [Myxococcota bacterium]
GSGTLATGNYTSSMVPVPSVNSNALVRLHAGWDFACFKRFMGDDTLHCWGSNEHFQTGQSSGSTVSTPAQVPTPPGVTITQLSLGHYHGCYLDGDSYIRCWGSNSSGQLGDGTVSDSATPLQIAFP